MRNNEIRIYWFLFSQFLKIATVVIGGGLVMIPMIEQIFVKRHKVMTKHDLVDMVAMTQTIPGLIAVNSAVFVGHKVAGWKGSLCAVTGVLIPSLLIIMGLAAFFPLLSVQNETILKSFDCVRAAITGVFIVTFFKIVKNVLRTPFDFIIIGILTVMALFKIATGWIIICALLSGVCYTYFNTRRSHA